MLTTTRKLILTKMHLFLRLLLIVLFLLLFCFFCCHHKYDSSQTFDYFSAESQNNILFDDLFTGETSAIEFAKPEKGQCLSSLRLGNSTVFYCSIEQIHLFPPNHLDISNTLQTSFALIVGKTKWHPYDYPDFVKDFNSYTTENLLKETPLLKVQFELNREQNIINGKQRATSTLNNDIRQLHSLTFYAYRLEECLLVAEYRKGRQIRHKRYLYVNNDSHIVSEILKWAVKNIDLKE